jgi:hypothetical protein
MMPQAPLHTVVETLEFASTARRLMSEDERARLIDHLARYPDSGAVIPGAGGARKLRWAIGGKGKRGGARIITFYGGRDVPVFLLAAFGKGAKTDLSQAERNELKAVLGQLVEDYLKGGAR